MPLTICDSFQDPWRVSDTVSAGVSVFATGTVISFAGRDLPSTVLAIKLTDSWRWADSRASNEFGVLTDAWRFSDRTPSVQVSKFTDAWSVADAVRVVRSTSLTDQWRWADSSHNTVIGKFVDQWRWADKSYNTANGKSTDAWRVADAVAPTSATISKVTDAWRIAGTDNASLARVSVITDQWRFTDVAKSNKLTSSRRDLLRWADTPKSFSLTSVSKITDDWFVYGGYVATAHKAWVTHMMTMAASRWDNLPYTSAAGGVMAGKGGTYVPHPTDKVESRLVTGDYDFDSQQQKVMAFAYAGSGAEAGTTTLRVSEDGNTPYQYTGEAYGNGNIKFNTGRGLRAKRFTFELAGKLQITELSVDVTAMNRRVK